MESGSEFQDFTEIAKIPVLSRTFPVPDKIPALFQLFQAASEPCKRTSTEQQHNNVPKFPSENSSFLQNVHFPVAFSSDIPALHLGHVSVEAEGSLAASDKSSLHTFGWTHLKVTLVF